MAVASGVTYLNPIRRERRGRAFLGSRLCKRSASETLIDPGHPPWSSATAYTYTLDCRSLGLMKNTFGVTALVGLAGFKTVLSTIVVGTSPSLPKARRVARQTSEASSTSYICTTSSSGTIRQRIQASPARTILVLVSSLGGETLSSITCLH